MSSSLIERYVAPADLSAGCFVGRAWVPGDRPGPSVVVLRPDGAYDISAAAATMSDLLDRPDPAAFARVAPGVRIGALDALLANSDPLNQAPDRPWLLSPFDLQAVKAAGVTFAASLLERVVEEQARGDPAAALSIRQALSDEIGSDLSRVRPGSTDAERLSSALKARGLWSQYLEVGIGPDP